MLSAQVHLSAEIGKGVHGERWEGEPVLKGTGSGEGRSLGANGKGACGPTLCVCLCVCVSVCVCVSLCDCLWSSTVCARRVALPLGLVDCVPV